MRRSMMIVLCTVLLTLLVADTLAIEGVKGGHRGHRPSGSVAINSTIQAGLCYKTIPYADALALNSTGQFPHNTLPSTHENGATNGLITILDCCDGYERNLTSGGCDPRCINACFGGKCTAPNVCTCLPGWFSQEGVCMPFCERPCQKDAYCFSPNVCACKLGYDEVNGECKPICPGGCNNGDCVAPRVCRCKPGFVLQPSTDNSALEPKMCVPVCENCRNGECIAPGVCNCREGYTNPLGDRETCTPICQGGCIGGDCVAPNICNCRPGYILESTGRCVPECLRGCPNGECVAPGVCTCRPGFTVDPSGNCIPIQTLPSLSSTSLCRYGCGANGTCVGPNRCVCDLGFRVDPDTGKCIPSPTSFQCRNGCGSHGVCVGPDLCICDYGLTPDPDTGRCPEPRPSSPINEVKPIEDLPVCRNGCGPNGRCVGPNRCICEFGFMIDPDTGRCIPSRSTQTGEPLCENPCINGQCIGLNRCTCNRGYAMDPYDPMQTKCLPVCFGGCPNGVCSGPNFCICNLGYRKETGVKGRQRCVPNQ